MDTSRSMCPKSSEWEALACELKELEKRAHDASAREIALSEREAALDKREREIESREAHAPSALPDPPRSVPGENYVSLIGVYGSDASHARSAWMSTQTFVHENTARIPRLLEMLGRNGHETPFEKSVLHFFVNTDLATHIHLLKHRIGVSINAESARYREIKDDDYYIPADWPEKWQRELAAATARNLALYHTATSEVAEHFEREGLSKADARRRAKETARFFRPCNAQIAADVMFNMRSFAHFYRLRAAPDAQGEIRDVARKMLAQIRAVQGDPFRHTLAALGLV